MSKFSVCVLICVGIFNCKLCTGNDIPLCASVKSTTKCFCRFKMKENFQFPIQIADCAGMKLKDFPRDSQLKNVEDLDLSKNLITTLECNTNSFENFKLLSLNLSFNKITDVFQDNFIHTPNLMVLDLSNNNLVSFPNSNIFRGLRNLTVLNLSFNSLSTLPENIFESLVNLKELNVQYNYLGAIFMDSFDIFKTNLGISYTITTLKIDGLGITNLTYEYFQEAQNLKYLSMADNPLEEIPSVPYTVDYLDLSGTHIKTISAKNLNYHSLKVLKLNRLKKLEKIEDYAFYNLRYLRELHLSKSKYLKEFNNLAFGVISDDMQWSLKKLFLARTGITNLNSSFFNVFKKLQHVDLQYNPWTCSCDTLWLQNLNGSLYRDENIRCFSPSNLRGKTIMKLSEIEMPDCFSDKNSVQKILISILGILTGLLVILILYLLYLGPFYSSRGIGPGSPYRRVTMSINPNEAENLTLE